MRRTAGLGLATVSGAFAVAAFVAENLYSRTPWAPEVEFDDELEYS